MIFWRNFLNSLYKRRDNLSDTFLQLNNADVYFAEFEEITYNNNTVATSLSTTKTIKSIDKKKFAAIALDIEAKRFVVYIVVSS